MDGSTNAAPNSKSAGGTINYNGTYLSQGGIRYNRRGNIVIIDCENVLPHTTGNDKHVCTLPFAPANGVRTFSVLTNASGVSKGLLLVDYRSTDLYANFAEAVNCFGSIVYITDE